MSWPCMGLLYLQFPIWKMEINDQSWLSAIDRNWLLTTYNLRVQILKTNNRAGATSGATLFLIWYVQLRRTSSCRERWCARSEGYSKRSPVQAHGGFATRSTASRSERRLAAAATPSGSISYAV